MTVKELIETLNQYDENLNVFISADYDGILCEHISVDNYFEKEQDCVVIDAY